MKAPVSSNMIDKKLGFSNKIRYKISVTTGCKKDAGTSARVYIAIKGSKSELSKFQLTKKRAKAGSSQFSFKPSTTNVFYCETRDVGDLVSVVVEHDGVSEEDSWYLKSIKILKCPVIDKSLINKVLTGDSLDPRMIYNAKKRGRFVTKGCKNTSWNFVCEDWLSLYIGDCLRKRQLYCRQTPETEYEVVVVTGNLENASGDGRVFLTIYGNTRESEKLFLDQSNNNIPFQRNQSDVFRIATNSVGAIRKIRVEHEGQGRWYLERVVITDLNNLSWRYYFHCKEWITRKILVASLNPMDVKQLATYKVTLYTGSQENAGTDANVYLTLVGNFGESTERRLSAKIFEAFKTGSVNEFNLESLHLGALMKVKVRHDNSGSHPDWFLVKVVVDDSLTDRIYTFHCNRWFSLKRSDGKISRDLFYDPDAINSSNERNRGGEKVLSKGKESYQIKVKTGDCRFAGTSANVYIIMYGPKKPSKEQKIRSSKDAKSSEKIWLENGKFERNSTEVFHIETTPDLFPLEKIDVGHDDKGLGAGWFLEEVKIKSMKTKMEQTFTCNKWLANDKDSVLERTLYPDSQNNGAETPKTTYKITTKTSDMMNAGTDANVWVKLFGDAGDTDDLKLSKSETNVNKFERNHEDVFLIKAPYIGKIRKLKVWHDGSGLGSRWHLSHVVVAFDGRSENHNLCRFDVERWIEGSKGSEDTNVVEVFPSRKSVDDAKTPQATYKVITKTSDITNAGTDANVWVKLFGDAGDTDDLKLSKSETNANKFERNHEDVFLIKAPYIGKIRKLKVWHDGSGLGSRWHLSHVVVAFDGRSENHNLCRFDVERWIEGSKGSEDTNVVEVFPSRKSVDDAKTPQATYKVITKTSDITNAGTDANVWVKLFGDAGDTDDLKLSKSETNANKFERNHEDVFLIKAPYIGKLRKLKIWHDGSGFGSSWHLSGVNVEFENKKGNRVLHQFPVNRWIEGSKANKDGIVLEAKAEQRNDKVSKDLQATYEVNVWTGDEKNAGTDTNVFIQMFGDRGSTNEIYLDDKKNNFERAHHDVFKIDEVDIGNIKKIRVGHDNSGIMPGWFLDKILIRKSKETQPNQNSKSNKNDARRSSKYANNDLEDSIKDYLFICQKWFDKGKGDGQLVRELYPTERGDGFNRNDQKKGSFAATRPRTSYEEEDSKFIIRVKTGDVSGAGTDANVFLTLVGSDDESKEFQLDDSLLVDDDNNDDNKSQKKIGKPVNKFEKGKEDTFEVSSKHIGDLKRLIIRHDNKGLGAAWFVEWITVYDARNGRKYFFPCEQWLSSNPKEGGKLTRVLLPVDSEKDLRNSDKRPKRSQSTNSQENRREPSLARNSFDLKSFQNRRLSSSRSSLKHRNYGSDENDYDEDMPDNYDSYDDEDYDADDYSYKADDYDSEAELRKLRQHEISRSLNFGKTDKRPSKSLIDPQERTPRNERKLTEYCVEVHTGNKFGAGTDANAYIVIFGSQGTTGMLELKESQNRNKFEKSQMDRFLITAPDVGNVKKIAVGHDASGVGSDWFLEKVKLTLTSTGKNWTFPCNEWLTAEDNEKELNPN